MSEYAPLRDAFHELNRLLIDKQQWDAEHEQRQQDQGLKRMMTESSLQDHALQRKELELKSKEAEAKMAPASVNFYEYMPNNPHTQTVLAKNPELGNNIAKVFGGIRMDPATGDVLGPGDEKVQMPNFEKGLKSVAAAGLITGALDINTMTDSNISTIDKGIADRQAQLKTIQDIPVNAQKRGILNNEIARLKGQKQTQVAYRDDPDARLGLLRQQQEIMRGFAGQAVASGAGPELARLFMNDQDNITKQIVSLEAHKMEMERARSKEKSERIPTTKMLVLVDPNDPSKIVDARVVRIPMSAPDASPAQLGFPNHVFQEQAEFNKPGKVSNAQERYSHLNESLISKDISLAHGKVSENKIDIIINPREVFDSLMDQTIFRNNMAEMKIKNEKFDWSKVSHAGMVQHALDNGRAQRDAYYQLQASRDNFPALIKELGLPPKEAAARLKKENDEWKKKMEDLTKAFMSDYGGVPPLENNKHKVGTPAFAEDVAARKQRGY